MALYAFDGTGDRWETDTPVTETQRTKKGRFLTNVVMFLKYYEEGNDSSYYYFPGVGTSGGLVGYMFGGAFGTGAHRRVNKAFKKLKTEFSRDEKADEEIVIIGYSRGAAIARLFADKIFRDYRKIKRSDGKPLTSRPQIKFLGLFDTVASFGNPFDDNEYMFKDRIPKNVLRTVHAMSLDERNDGFGLDRAYGRNILEVWFKGGHGDIGGNSETSGGTQRNSKRANISLLFMLKEALKAKVQVDIPALDIDFDAPIWLNEKERTKFINRVVDSVADSREAFVGDFLHDSVYNQKHPDNQTDGVFQQVTVIEGIKKYLD